MKLAVFILVAIAGLMTGTIIYAVRKGNGLTRLSLRRALLTNISCFALIVACAVLMPLSGVYADEEQPVTDVSSQADEGESDGLTDPDSSAAGFGYLAAALATGAAAVGAGIAVASGASAAIGATGEDPKMFGKALIFVTLGEGIAIYGILISFVILNKIG